MHKDGTRPGIGRTSAPWHIAWLLALTVQGTFAASPAARTGSANGIRFPDPCAPSAQALPADDSLLLWGSEEFQQRQIAAAVKKEMQRHLEKLPTTLRCAWWEAFRDNSAAEQLLYAQAREERKTIESKVFGDIAALLGRPTIADLYLHTDLADEQGVILEESHVTEPLTDFVRRGIDFGLRMGATKNGRDYIQYTRVNDIRGHSGKYDPDIGFQKVIDVLTSYDAAGEIQEIIHSRFSDKTSPWSTSASVKNAAKAELRFAGLEALRKGEITLAQYRWFVASIDADRSDGKGKLTYVQYALRVGRTWFSGQAAHPIQLPAFNIRLSPSTREQFTTNFLYVPGHPDGSLRVLPVGASPSAMILGDVNNAEKDHVREHGRKVLAWLASRLPPADFHELLGELTERPAGPAPTGHAPDLATMPLKRDGRRVKRAIQEKTEDESSALTDWLSRKLQELFGTNGEHTANVKLELYPAGERPMRFIDAVASSQLSRVRSSMDPRFVGNLDADCARLEQIAMGVVDEIVGLALLPFPVHRMESLQLLSILGLMTHGTATYLARTRAHEFEGTQLVADLADFGISLGLGVGAAKLGQRQRGPVPTLYTAPGSGKKKLWFDFDTRKYALPALPEGATAATQGVYVKGGEFFVRLKTKRGEETVRVVRDGTAHRIALADGSGGPLLRPWRDGLWKLPLTEQSINSSTLAKLLLEDYTTDAATLAQTRKVMRQFGLKERDLVNMREGDELLGANQIMLGAISHAIVEQQVGRLRNRQNGRWTAREVNAIVPAMARHIHRPVAVLANDGSIETAALADGAAVAAEDIPANTLRVRRQDDRYLVSDPAQADPPPDYFSIFAAVDAASRPPGRAVDPVDGEARFRTALSDSIAGTTMRASLERLHEQWIALLDLPSRQKEAFKEVSLLQLALRDKHHALTAAEERQLLTAARELMPEGMRVAIEVRRHGTRALLAAFDDDTPAASRVVIEADLDKDGRRIAYYRQNDLGDAILSRPVEESLSPLLDVTLNAGRGEVRRALKMGEYQWADFADRLIERIVDNQNALLPEGLEHLLVKGSDVSDPAGKASGDSWIVNGRRYARLTNLANRAHVVETGPPGVDGTHEILSPHKTGNRGSGRFIVQRDGKWYPTDRLRHAYDPLDAAGRTQAAASIRQHMKNAPTAAVMENILDAIPQPLLNDVAQRLTAVEVDAGYGLVLTLDSPTGGTWSYRTMLDADGKPSALATRADAAAASRPVAPAPHNESRPSLAERHHALDAYADAGKDKDSEVIFRELIERNAPVSTHIALDVGDKHIRSLMDARRLRGMLAEDDAMVMVASVPGHTFTVILPGDAGLPEAGSWATIADLPAGTRIVDSWYGFSGDAASYADRIRAIAKDWHAKGTTIRQADSKGAMQTVTPPAFTEQVLSAPVRIATWNPRHDPISEAAYVDYLRYRQDRPILRRRAGLDWLTTDAARRDYLRYFAPPFGSPGADGRDIASMAALLTEVRAIGRRPNTPAASPALVTRSISHEEALADFHNWLKDDGTTRPLVEDWEFDLDLLDD